MIYLSHSAVKELKRLQLKYQKSNMVLRVGIQPSGCSGMSYKMEFEPEPRHDDQIYEYSGARVVVDPQSLIYINGLRLDYTEDLMGGGFRFHNPNAVQTCGCGNSFAVNEQPILV